MTALEIARKTAPPAVATELCCVASAHATSLTLDKTARGTLIHFLHHTKTTVAQAQMPQCAVAGGSVWRASASARCEQTRRKDTVDDSVSAATLTVLTRTTGMTCDNWNSEFAMPHCFPFLTLCDYRD